VPAALDANHQKKMDEIRGLERSQKYQSTKTDGACAFRPTPAIAIGRQLPVHRLTAGRFNTSHAAGHRRRWEWSLSNSCLRASFPALLAATMV
jgi:hypothetical protein